MRKKSATSIDNRIHDGSLNLSKFKRLLGQLKTPIEKTGFWDAPIEQYAHVIIDVQKDFCDPKRSKRATQVTKSKANRIAKLTPTFREALTQLRAKQQLVLMT